MNNIEKEMCDLVIKEVGEQIEAISLQMQEIKHLVTLISEQVIIALTKDLNGSDNQEQAQSEL